MNAAIINQINLNFNVKIPSNDTITLLVSYSYCLLTSLLNVLAIFQRLKIANYGMFLGERLKSPGMYSD